MFLSFVSVILSVFLSYALGSPIAAAAATTNSPIYTGSCAPVSAVVSLLHAQTFASSFCSSFLPITTHTASTTTTYTSTTTAIVISTTGTNTGLASPITLTLPTQTITASEVDITLTADPISLTGSDTLTITGSTATVSVTNVITTTVCGAGVTNKKREAFPATTKTTTTTPKPTSTSSKSSSTSFKTVSIPSILSSIASSKISSACSCLNLPTPTTTLTVSTTATIGTTITSSVAGTATATPTTTLTPLMTFTPFSTIFTTPIITLIPTFTLTPTQTITIITTTTVTVGAVTGTPSVVLASPTPIFSNNANYDDQYTTVTLPFPLTFYDVSASTVTVSINGFIGLAGFTSVSYTNQPLPDTTADETTLLPDTAVCAFWDDLYIYQGTPQGIYYEIDGLAPARNVSFEWYTSHYNDPTQYYHFIMTFQEAKPDIVTYSYFQVSDLGGSATVGAQSISMGKSTQYSFNTPDIFPGLQLTYNMATNSFQQSNDVTCVAGN